MTRRLSMSLAGALVAGAITAAGASASTLTLKTAAGALPAGAPITASSTDFKFITSGGGELECDLTSVSGTLSNNGSAIDVASMTSGSFSQETMGKPCPTTSGLGPAVVEVLNFPWSLALGANGVVHVTAHRKATFRATFTVGGKQGSCIYETSKVTGSDRSTGPLVLNATGQRFSLHKAGSARQCPASGTVSGQFAFTSAGEVVEAEV